MKLSIPLTRCSDDIEIEIVDNYLVTQQYIYRSDIELRVYDLNTNKLVLSLIPYMEGEIYDVTACYKTLWTSLKDPRPIFEKAELLFEGVKVDGEKIIIITCVNDIIWDGEMFIEKC